MTNAKSHIHGRPVTITFKHKVLKQPWCHTKGIDRSLMFIRVHFHCRFLTTDMKESEASHIARLPKVSKDVYIFQDIYIYIYIYIDFTNSSHIATSLATVNCTAVYSTPSESHALNISCLLVSIYVFLQLHAVV